MTIDVTRSGHRPRRDCFRRNCYRFCCRFVIVSVAESWTIFWDNMRFQRHSQLQCRKWRVERINSSCKCLQYVYVKVSEFNAELEMKHKDCLRRKPNHKNSFIEKCYRFFSFYRFFNPQHTWEILGNIHINQIERGFYKLPHVVEDCRQLKGEKIKYVITNQHTNNKHMDRQGNKGR